ncbi:MAG: hypothetical protein QNJ37_24110 [Crocosphaera sp.]|nr:hypothetical protein [Crocosphaera sp.]
MSETKVFEDILVTETYAQITEKFCSNKQRLLFESLSKCDRLLYSTGCKDGISTDLYGLIKIQSIANEDRLFFPQNQAHVHVKWSQVCMANLVKWPDHPGGKDCFWIGIEFLNRDRQSLFYIWNLKADQEFSPEVCEHLGALL